MENLCLKLFSNPYFITIIFNIIVCLRTKTELLLQFVRNDSVIKKGVSDRNSLPEEELSSVYNIK
jgi:hypothetical protein